MRIITLAEAINQGSSASELRVLANCLDRIAKDGYPIDVIGDTGLMFVDREPAYDYKACRENAAALRRLARQVQNEPAYRKRVEALYAK